MTSAGARFGIVFLPESLGDFGSLCREAEEAGFDLLGVADSQSVFRELYVALAIAARDTSRIRLGPLVTNPQTRHLVVTASAISSIDELSGGRAMLGLGSGDSAIYTLGAPPATVAGLEDAVVTPIKMALAASANHAFRFTLEGKAVPPDLHERIRGLQKEYDAHQHEIAGAANADLTERWGLTEFLRDRFGIAGTPEDCVAQVRRAMAAGARQFIITAFVPDVRALMRRFMREVAAAVATPA